MRREAAGGARAGARLPYRRRVLCSWCIDVVMSQDVHTLADETRRQCCAASNGLTRGQRAGRSGLLSTRRRPPTHSDPLDFGRRSSTDRRHQSSHVESRARASRLDARQHHGRRPVAVAWSRGPSWSRCGVTSPRSTFNITRWPLGSSRPAPVLAPASPLALRARAEAAVDSLDIIYDTAHNRRFAGSGVPDRTAYTGDRFESFALNPPFRCAPRRAGGRGQGVSLSPPPGSTAAPARPSARPAPRRTPQSGGIVS